MIVLYGYFEDYLVKLSIKRGCVPVFNSEVKFIRGVSNAVKSRTRLRNLCNFTKITPGLHPDYTGITHVCNSYLTHIYNLICICNSYL